MLDFPNSPTTNQIFAAGGMTWRWDGSKWTETAGTLALADAPSDGNTYGRRNTAWNSVDAMLAPVAANANAALNGTGRNLLHNPLFDVQQRGAGPWTAGGYNIDQWALGFVGGTSSLSAAALTDADRAAIGDEAARYAMQHVMTGTSGAGDYNGIQQYFEGVRRFSNRTITLSFWAKAAAGTPALGLSISQAFGSGGSPSAVVNFNGVAITLSTAWTRYSLTFNVASTAGKVFGTNGDDYFQLNFWFSSGATNNTLCGGIGVQSGTFSFWGMQLEYGSVATPLEKRDPQIEMDLCRRFYQPLSYRVAAAAQATTWVFSPPMRITPTITGGATGFATSGASANSVTMSQTTAAVQSLVATAEI